MKDDLRCTLITPLRNERDNVEKLWNTIHGQSRPPEEWFICDNGSDDGTFEWLCEAAKKSPIRVQVLPLKGLTIARMLNAAIARIELPESQPAVRAVIACCHGGTRIPKDWLQNLVAPLQDEKIDVSAGVWEAYGETAVEKWLASGLPRSVIDLDESVYLPASRSLAFRLECWRKVGGFPEWLPRFGEDTLFALRLRDAGFRIAIARNALIGWRPKPSLKLYLRQERLYFEANSLMGLTRLGWKEYLRPWILLPVALLAGLIGKTFIAGLVVFAALPFLDLLRYRWKGLPRYPSLGTFLFLKWVLPVAHQAGHLIGRRMAGAQGIQVPSRDAEIVRRYREQLLASR